MKRKKTTKSDYILAYFGVILIVAVGTAFIYALGIFNPETWAKQEASGFPGFTVPDKGWELKSDGTFTIIVQNSGYNINVTGITVTYGNVVKEKSVAVYLKPNTQATFIIQDLGSPEKGSFYNISVEITYDNIDLELRGVRSFGTVTGRVTE